jgi:hypothetical protein
VAQKTTKYLEQQGRQIPDLALQPLSDVVELLDFCVSLFGLLFQMENLGNEQMHVTEIVGDRAVVATVTRVHNLRHQWRHLGRLGRHALRE